MTVELLTEPTPGTVEAMGCLIPRLSRSAKSLNVQACERFIFQPGVHFFIYRPDTAGVWGEHPILGMFSPAIFEIPTDARAWIEGVVVDEAAHDQGAGPKLVEVAFEQVKKVGARTIGLTSHPSREAANHLYRRIDFE